MSSLIVARIRTTCAGLALVLGATACAGDATAPAVPSAPVASATPIAALTADSTVFTGETPRFLACPSPITRSASRVIGPAGGIIVVDGSAIAIPRGAVRKPTEFTFTIPADSVLRVDISATGAGHYEFHRPVAVTIDYSRCGDAVTTTATTFGAWYIDGPSLMPLAFMGGVDDRFSRRVIFLTDHLSGYAIAQGFADPSDPSDLPSGY